MPKTIFTMIVALIFFTMGSQSHAKSEFGAFKGDLVTKADPNGKDLVVVKPFSYIDQKGRKWPVPAGQKTDGASVPRFFWTMFPPFTGKHRFAAVIHDRYCRKRTRPWREVHLMFYNAMRAAGVNYFSAKTMYGAVYTFGPRWSMTGSNRSPKRPTLSEKKQVQAFKNLQKWIKANDPSPQEIQRHVNRTQLRQKGVKAAP